MPGPSARHLHRLKLVQGDAVLTRLSKAKFLSGAQRQKIGDSPANPRTLVQQDTDCNRAWIEQVLAELGTLRDMAGKRTDDRILVAIAALLERAAELQVQTAERRLERLTQQLNRPPTPERTHRAPLGITIEHRDPSGICRVCAQPAPPAHGLCNDNMRVCVNETCRQEAHRCGNVPKQRPYNER